MSTNTRLKAGPKAADAAEQWLGRSHLSSFIRCLHLLDLDLLEDWPGITVQTLSTRSATQGLQQRVKAVEWSLFRLFELYDAQLTRDVGAGIVADAVLLTLSETLPLFPSAKPPPVTKSPCSTSARTDGP